MMVLGHVSEEDARIHLTFQRTSFSINSYCKRIWRHIWQALPFFLFFFVNFFFFLFHFGSARKNIVSQPHLNSFDQGKYSCSRASDSNRPVCVCGVGGGIHSIKPIELKITFHLNLMTMTNLKEGG